MNVTVGRVLTAASVVVFAATALGINVDSVSVSEAISAGLALLGAGQLTHD